MSMQRAAAERPAEQFGWFRTRGCAGIDRALSVTRMRGAPASRNVREPEPESKPRASDTPEWFCSGDGDEFKFSDEHARKLEQAYWAVHTTGRTHESASCELEIKGSTTT